MWPTHQRRADSAPGRGSPMSAYDPRMMLDLAEQHGRDLRRAASHERQAHQLLSGRPQPLLTRLLDLIGL